MQTAISFVRHGEVYNPDNIFYGRLSGFRLSDNGNYQAVQAAETLKSRLTPFGIADGYPALASITTFSFRTTLDDEMPVVAYVRPYNR